MATYNGERFIRQQLQSILSQLGDADEVIISDDGSTDSTLFHIKNFDDSRIRIIRNEGKKGINGNFQNTLLHAKGDVIFLADQDDVWMEGKVKKCLEVINDYDCIVHDCMVTELSLNPTSGSLFALNGGKSGFLHNILRNGFTGCCMCFRRELLPQILPFPDSNAFFYDQWIGLRAEMKGRTCFLPEPLIKFRRHQESSSSASGKSRRSLTSKISSRLSLLKHLILFDLTARKDK